MPVLVGAAMMDTDRMIPTPQQNGSSPGGGSSEPINPADSSGGSNAHNSSTSPPAMVAPADQHSMMVAPNSSGNAFISPAPLYINSAARKKKAERPPPPPVPPSAGHSLLGHPDHLAGGGLDASSSLSIGQSFGSSRPQPPPPPAINIPPTPGSMNHYVNEAVAMGGGNGGIVNMGYSKDR